MSKIKIFSTYSQCVKQRYVENEIVTPVLAGAITKNNSEKMQGDDEGENLSAKNDVYCELTTQYWAWKNVDLDYYGFCHYRRWFSFNPKTLESDAWKVVNCAYANETTKKKLYLDEMTTIKKTVNQYDVLVAEAIDLKKVGHNSLYEHFLQTPFMKIEALDYTMEIIRDFYPDYYDCARKYMYGPVFYPYNMFIMSKKVFSEYSEWLFGILEKLCEKLDMKDYSIQSRRVPAHIGERLLGVYITYLKEHRKELKIKELQVGFIHNTTMQETILPKYEKNNIPIVMAANEFFSPIMSAAIYSMVENSSKENNYDIVVLESNIEEKTKKRLQNMVAEHENVSIRFYNVASLIEPYDLYISKLITVETYYRFFIPELFKKFDKVLYLDGDIIVKNDVAELYRQDIGNNLVGAVHDVTVAGLVNGFDKESLIYCTKKMKLKNPLDQFNAGVMVMNLVEFRKKYSTKYMLKFAEEGKFRYWDQDALNILCQGKVKWLDSAWNFFADEKNGWRGRINQFAPKEMYDKYVAAGKNPYIYHFAGNEKPWFDPNYEYAEVFWHYMRKTPFYEMLLHRRITDISCFWTDKRLSEMQIPTAPRRKIIIGLLRRLMPEGTGLGDFARKVYSKLRRIFLGA